MDIPLKLTNFLSQKYLSKFFYLTKNRYKKFRNEENHYFVSKIILGSKNQGSKNVMTKNLFCPKIVWTFDNSLGCKIFWVE